MLRGNVVLMREGGREGPKIDTIHVTLPLSNWQLSISSDVAGKKGV